MTEPHERRDADEAGADDAGADEAGRRGADRPPSGFVTGAFAAGGGSGGHPPSQMPTGMFRRAEDGGGPEEPLTPAGEDPADADTGSYAAGAPTPVEPTAAGGSPALDDPELAKTRLEPPPPGSTPRPATAPGAETERVPVPLANAADTGQVPLAEVDTVHLPPAERATGRRPGPPAPATPDPARAETLDLPPPKPPPAATPAAPPGPTPAAPPRGGGSGPPPPAEGGGLGRAVAVLLVLLLLAGGGVLAWTALRERLRDPEPRVEVSSPRPSEWLDPADGPVEVTGVVPDLLWGRARLEGGGPAVELDPEGRFALAAPEVEDGVHELVLVVEGRVDGAWEPFERRVPLTLRVDRAPPALELLAPAAGAETGPDVTVRFRASDPSGLKLIMLRLDGQPERVAELEGGEVARTLEGLAPGPHVLRIEAVDASGKAAAPVERRFVVVADGPGPDPSPTPDPSPPPPAPLPRVRLVWPPGGVLGPGVVEAEVREADAVEVLLDGERVARRLPYALRAERVDDGDHVLEVRATSAGGRASEARAFVFDGTPPEIRASVAARFDRPPIRIEGAVRDRRDPAPTVTLSVDGGPPRPVELPATIERVSPGAVELRLEARDDAGNVARRTLRTRVVSPAEVDGPPADGRDPPPADRDEAGPTIEAPRERAFTARPQIFEVAARDPAGVAGLTATVRGRDDPVQITDEGGGRFSLCVDLPPGEYALDLAARDGRGNAAHRVVRLRVEAPPPPPKPTGRVVFPERSGPNVKLHGDLPAGSIVAVDVGGERRARGTLPLEIRLAHGSHVVVARDVATGRTFEGRVEVDARAPVLRRVVLEQSADGRRVTVRAEVRDGGRVTFLVTRNGDFVARGLPAEFALVEGTNRIAVTARDEFGNARTERQELVRAAPRPPRDDEVDEDERDEDEGARLPERLVLRFAGVLEALAGERWAEAIRLLDEVLRGTSSERGTRLERGYARLLRAEARLGLAGRQAGTRRAQTLTAAKNDIVTAIVVLGEDVRPEHLLRKAEILEALGQGREAAAARAAAEALRLTGGR